VQPGHVTFGPLADKIAGHGGGQHTDQADAGEHEHHRHASAARRDRVLIAVAHGGDGDGRPPQRVAEVVDVGARRVLLESELGRRADADDGQYRQQHEVQAVVRQQFLSPLKSAGQGQPGPGEREQPQQPQRPEHRYGDDEQVDEVAMEERPARRGQVQLDQVLGHEDRPDQVVDHAEGAGDTGREPRDQGNHQYRQPHHGQHHQRYLDRGGETVIRVLRPPKVVHRGSPKARRPSPCASAQRGARRGNAGELQVLVPPRYQLPAGLPARRKACWVFSGKSPSSSGSRTSRARTTSPARPARRREHHPAGPGPASNRRRTAGPGAIAGPPRSSAGTGRSRTPIAPGRSGAR